MNFLTKRGSDKGYARVTVENAAEKLAYNRQKTALEVDWMALQAYGRVKDGGPMEVKPDIEAHHLAETPAGDAPTLLKTRKW